MTVKVSVTDCSSHTLKKKQPLDLGKKCLKSSQNIKLEGF